MKNTLSIIGFCLLAGACWAAPGAGSASIEPLLADLPVAQRSAILADQAGFTALVGQVLAGPRPLWRLVDKQTPLPEDYVPDELLALEQIKPRGLVAANREGMQVSKLAVPQLQALFQASRKAGVSLQVVSAYRSYRYQIGTFERNVKELGMDEALRVSARPGFSQHQLGLALDFNSLENSFASTKAGKWLKANASRFGFSLSYPEGQEARTGYAWESWHYRYLGVPACALQDRFFEGSQQSMLAFLHLHGKELADRLGIPSGGS